MAAEENIANDVALSQTDINWDRLDKTKFHVIGAFLFSAVSALLHPIAVVTTRIQVAGGELGRMNGLAMFRHILKADGVSGLFRGLGTELIGCLPGRMLLLTSLEVCQKLMVQGLPGMTKYNGGLDAVQKILKTEGIRGLYRGFGISMLTYSPSSAVWWGAYGSAQHIIWRSLGYGDNQEKRSPQQWEIVLVQATAGTLAGAASSVVTTPLDTVKTRLQVIDNYGEGRPTIAKTIKQLLKEDGWKGFYRGLGPRFLDLSLWGTSMIVTYEIIKRLSVKDL